jgi:hypothetical protein
VIRQQRRQNETPLRHGESECRNLWKTGAGEGIRTLDPNLSKVGTYRSLAFASVKYRIIYRYFIEIQKLFSRWLTLESARIRPFFGSLVVAQQ